MADVAGAGVMGGSVREDVIVWLLRGNPSPNTTLSTMVCLSQNNPHLLKHVRDDTPLWTELYLIDAYNFESTK